VQQYVIRRRLGPMRPPKPPDEKVAADGKTSDGKSGGLGGMLHLPTRQPATVGASAQPKAARPTGPPPAPPKKKKKRSGRRR